MRHKVTVAIPTYNRAHYLPEAINSVLSQTFRDFELLVLDNASTDSTPAVVESFSDSRIRYVRNEANIGMFGNCNKALELAQGEYVVVFHDDDVMQPEFLEAEVKILDENEEVVLVGTNTEWIDERGRRIKARQHPITEDITFEQYEYIERWYRDDIGFAFPTVMLRKSILKEKHLYFRQEVGYGADGYLWYEINLSRMKLYLIARPLLRYRIHSAQATSVGYDYNQWRSFFRHTHKLIVDNNLNQIMPVFKRRVTHAMLHKLMHRVAFAHINKKELIGELEKLKSEKFWYDDSNISEKFKFAFKFFVAVNFPDIARQLYRIKQGLPLFRGA